MKGKRNGIRLRWFGEMIGWRVRVGYGPVKGGEREEMLGFDQRRHDESERTYFDHVDGLYHCRCLYNRIRKKQTQEYSVVKRKKRRTCRIHARPPKVE